MTHSVEGPPGVRHGCMSQSESCCCMTDTGDVIESHGGKHNAQMMGLVQGQIGDWDKC